jgi:dTDP-glucose pyrophosphorylase/CBS domain-containing protein
MVEVSKVCIREENTLGDAMRCINASGAGIALVVDAERRLRCTITDGDLRRALLGGLGLDETVARWAATVPEQGNRRPTTAPVGTPAPEVLRLMRANDVRQLPLLDAEGRVARLALLSDFVGEDELPVRAVVMAGGFGTRLYPLTKDVPKPMLPVGGRPLLEHIVTQLRDAGIRRITVTTHYKPDVIVGHFGDGSRFGVEIEYVHEETPLGTAGALGLMPPPGETQLVINGDILTQVNYRAMLQFHRDNGAVMTMGVREYAVQVPYGVVETEGAEVRRLSEKPTLRFFVNAGVYLLEPLAHRHLRRGERTDMTDVIARVLADKQRVASFPIGEYWLDIGRPPDYERAQTDAAKGASS